MSEQIYVKTDELTKIIHLINKNGGYRGNHISDGQYNHDELMGILEYGDHRSFAQNEFSQDIIFYTQKNGKINTATGVLADKYAKTHEDLYLAKKLGGYRMYNNILKTLDKRTNKFNKKQKEIKHILRTLPERFRHVADYIIKYDLKKFIEFSLDHYLPRLKKSIMLLVEHRANELGVYTTRNELCVHLSIEKRGIFKFLHEMREARMFDKQSNDIIIDTIRQTSFNHLFDMRDYDIISEKELIQAQSILKNIEVKYPDILRARANIAVGLSILVIRLLRKNQNIISLLKKCNVFLKLDQKQIAGVYQAIKRAENRCAAYTSDIKNQIYIVEEDITPSLDEDTIHENDQKACVDTDENVISERVRSFKDNHVKSKMNEEVNRLNKDHSIDSIITNGESKLNTNKPTVKNKKISKLNRINTSEDSMKILPNNYKEKIHEIIYKTRSQIVHWKNYSTSYISSITCTTNNYYLSLEAIYLRKTYSEGKINDIIKRENKQIKIKRRMNKDGLRKYFFLRNKQLISSKGSCYG